MSFEGEKMFIDWLSVYQVYPANSIPVLGSDLVCTYDLATGEQKREVIYGYEHPGSFDSSIRIRSNGTVLEVSGNPSRYGRPTNLFGRSSIGQCLDLYNLILKDVGLPEFEDRSVHNYLRPHQIQSSDRVVVDRPIITRVDITTNLATTGAVETIRYLSGHHWRDAAHLYANGRTVDWNRGSRKIYVKYYDKANEISLRKSKDENIEGQQMKEIKYCDENKVIRFEVSLKSQWLKRRGYDDPAKWGESTLEEISAPYQIHRRQQTQGAELDRVAERLITLGVRPRLANQCEIFLKAWLQGGGVLPISRATLYRYRKPILLLGVDVMNPPNITVLPMRIGGMVFRELERPEWYSEVPTPEQIVRGAAA